MPTCACWRPHGHCFPNAPRYRFLLITVIWLRPPLIQTDCVLFKIAKEQRGKSWVSNIEGDTGAQRTMGHLHTLDVEHMFGEQEFPNDVEIATRLGVKDRILRFVLNLSGPFGEPIKDLPIRHHLLPKGLSPDAEPFDINQTETRLTFRLGTAQFRYTRLGLERLQDDYLSETGGLP